MISISALWRRQKNASKQASFIHRSLINAPDNTKILELAPPPELNTFMGGTNNPVDLLIKKYGRERLESWLLQVGATMAEVWTETIASGCWIVLMLLHSYCRRKQRPSSPYFDKSCNYKQP